MDARFLGALSREGEVGRVAFKAWRSSGNQGWDDSCPKPPPLSIIPPSPESGIVLSFHCISVLCTGEVIGAFVHELEYRRR